MQLIRVAVSTAVETTARLLSFAGSAMGTVSRLLDSRQGGGGAPDASGPAPSTADVLERVEESSAADRRGRVIELPDTPLLDAQPHVRRPETHIAEFADRPASQVIAEVDHLSTDELGHLFEHESSRRNRKTVLAAIERALAPVPSGAPTENGRR